MVKKLLIFAFLLLFSFGIFAPVLAKEPTMVSEINAFEFFWPLVAGKTQGESLYGLKRFKENARGWLIFSPIKKADYLAFLATKRVLEIEKLSKEGKLDLAKKTVNQAVSDIEKSDKNLAKSIASSEQGGPTRAALAEKLNKLETFLKWFQETQVELKTEIQSLLGKVMVEAGKL